MVLPTTPFKDVHYSARIATRSELDVKIPNEWYQKSKKKRGVEIFLEVSPDKVLTSYLNVSSEFSQAQVANAFIP